MEIPTLAETVAFMKMAHAGQKDANGLEYFHHPIDVLNHLPHWASDNLKKAAVLHDTPEDTPYKRLQLEALGHTKRTLDIVDGVTNPEEDAAAPKRSYDEWIADYHAHIDHIIESGDEDVIVLKHTDMGRNYDPKRNAGLPDNKRAHYQRKYAVPFAKLGAAVAEIAKKYPQVPAGVGGKLKPAEAAL